MRKLHSRKFIIAVLAAMVAMLGAFSAYSYIQLREFKNDPRKITAEEARDLAERVSKLILLPAGEDPTIATIFDPDKLSDQPFFVNAKKGDKVLIFTSAKKVYLYRASENKIIEAAPLNTGNSGNIGAAEMKK